MKKARKVIAAALVGFMAMGLLAGCGGGKKDEGPVTMKLGTTVNEQDSFQVAALKFKELVEERTEGKYVIDFDKARAAVDAWANLIITTQATGNFEFAQQYSAEHANITEALAADIAKVNGAGIPRDIRFDFTW